MCQGKVRVFISLLATMNELHRRENWLNGILRSTRTYPTWGIVDARIKGITSPFVTKKNQVHVDMKPSPQEIIRLFVVKKVMTFALFILLDDGYMERCAVIIELFWLETPAHCLWRLLFFMCLKF